jgi:hypothetical protein
VMYSSELSVQQSPGMHNVPTSRNHFPGLYLCFMGICLGVNMPVFIVREGLFSHLQYHCAFMRACVYKCVRLYLSSKSHSEIPLV